MLGVGSKMPQFKLKAVKGGDLSNIKNPDDAFMMVENNTYKGKWTVLFFYPKDFTFVCPTEIAEFGKLTKDFADRDAQVLGASVDSEFVHMAWRKDHKDLNSLPFPLMADFKRELSFALGIVDQDGGFSQRATYLVDPEGVIRFVYVTDGKVGRNPSEVLRILDALQSDELCPCNWKKGDAPIKLAA